MHLAEHVCDAVVLDFSHRFEMRNRLKSQLDGYHAEFTAASARFDAMMKERPSGLPHPDGTLRIRQAGIDSRVALRKYMRALREFTDFTVAGILPEGLPGKPRQN